MRLDPIDELELLVYEAKLRMNGVPRPIISRNGFGPSVNIDAIREALWQEIGRNPIPPRIYSMDGNEWWLDRKQR